MGKYSLVCRLATRDLRRRPAEAALLMLAIVAGAATLSLGLCLHGVTSDPYAHTRAATAGPDVVVSDLSSTQVGSFVHASGVTGHSGPYPIALVVLQTRGITVVADAEGRGRAPAAIDQPEVTDGSWVRSNGVVLERAFAGALGVRVGDRVRLNGRSFLVVGIAVTAALPEFPQVCSVGCQGGPAYDVGVSPRDTGLVWLTEENARSLATPVSPLTYTLNLRLKDPTAAPAFVAAYNETQSVERTSPHAFDAGIAANMVSWQTIREVDGRLVADGQQVLLVGSWLLGLLALASLVVLAGGRMAEQTRRVGLLKAVGATSGTVASVLLAEYLTLALIAAAVGLVTGWRAAPLLTGPGAGLVGSPGAASMTISAIGLVVAVALGVALLATVVPTIRTARTSTMNALSDLSRPPRRRRSVGLRLAARRPRRAVLSAASTAITVTMVVALLAFHATADQKRFGGTSGLRDPVVVRDSQVLLVLSVMLVVLAAVNAIFITWATVIDARRSSALARALGATPQQVGAGLAAAQLLFTIPGSVVGIPLGIGLFAAANRAGLVTIPPILWLLAVVIGTLLVVLGLTAIPARLGARRPVVEVLQSEFA
jgi:putative ABC transport system permease protein